MTQDEIIEMARQAGGMFSELPMMDAWVFGDKSLEAFAKLVAQHERERIKVANAPEIERVNAHIKELENAILAEREACANLCEQHGYEHYCGNVTDKLAETIRARGQA
jgi:hypothetical protein